MSSTSVEKETGMLDVGTHCEFCRQLDFLPFHCSFCNKDFCSSHRTKESHYCPSLETIKKDQLIENGTVHSGNNNEKYFKSLLPEKAHERIKQSKQQQQSSRITIKSTLNESSLNKLKKFFQSKRSKPIVKRSSNRVTDLVKLQKAAQGDSKIPVPNRVYIYAKSIDNNDSEFKPIYINKIWPIGRSLDYIAKQLSVVNNNANSNTDRNEKLFIYKLKDDQNLIQLNTGDRVSSTVSNLDYIYLIRGNEI
ncbi:hypothetical protein KAFR_0A07310 [Kazachstania africana CBS 2517]|uniref:AN1-type domain-containing protein n=1 Tax=Kazachstania africana (strain ATCC 22294 / BCRC 22015 / CBS 2517 / CECT 1963 / NBRC 1671 / NRRL Y-8276) TaxID=1071382 RepID=H2AP65_KAZAF|nr:hypothetical protein KAFR_0A07310 [Kazachstania africana CBS 2517]CCF56165.1 hypothetical protein KAFR_0A07310 [Kazachstania africana CBS 2517]